LVEKEGIAYEIEKSVIGEHTVGVPIFGRKNKVLGAISVVRSKRRAGDNAPGSSLMGAKT
jgi:DNA-binding IclR family transcriptional regulator